MNQLRLRRRNKPSARATSRANTTATPKQVAQGLFTVAAGTLTEVSVGDDDDPAAGNPAQLMQRLGDTGERQVFENLRSGLAAAASQVALTLARVLGVAVEPEVTGRYRVGDIRHCFADVAKARRVLGYEPRISLEEGLVELAEWLEGQMADDHVDAARSELSRRGLTV